MKPTAIMLTPIMLAAGTCRTRLSFIRFSVDITETFAGMNFSVLRSVFFEANQGRSGSGLECGYRNWR
jgi:hypothetical protein